MATHRIHGDHLLAKKPQTLIKARVCGFLHLAEILPKGIQATETAKVGTLCYNDKVSIIAELEEL